MNNIKFIELFIERLGEPNSTSALITYLDFINQCFTKDYSDIEYFEKHHILPQYKFKEYSKLEWNIVRLSYPDHIKAHELLYLAYTNRSIGRTLNFMKSKLIKDSKLLSIASKKGWQNLKNNKEKYDAFVKKRSDHMKTVSPEIVRQSQLKYWANISPEEYSKRCKSNKLSWTDSRKSEHSKKLSSYFKNNPDEIASRNKKRWDNLPQDKRLEFNKKMDVINKDVNKRLKAGHAIRNRWKDPEYYEKMKNRKLYEIELELISPSGEIFIRRGFWKVINEFNFSPHIVKKFLDTNTQATYKGCKQEGRNSVGWIFNQTNKKWKRHGKTNKS